MKLSKYQRVELELIQWKLKYWIHTYVHSTMKYKASRTLLNEILVDTKDSIEFCKKFPALHEHLLDKIKEAEITLDKFKIVSCVRRINISIINLIERGN